MIVRNIVFDDKKPPRVLVEILARVPIDNSVTILAAEDGVLLSDDDGYLMEVENG